MSGDRGTTVEAAVRTSSLGVISALCLIVTVVWLALLIYGIALNGAVETREQALDLVSERGALFTLTYVNATLVTLTATALFAGLSVDLGSDASLWAAIGGVFVPVYSLLNLAVYLSQITIVPRLVALRPESDLLLAQLVQQWNGSAISMLNNLGYAVLGIPSIIFGWLLARRRSLPVTGVLLALNGVACIVGIIGIAAGSEVLSLGSLVGGVLFLAALVPLSARLLHGD